jgi:hypothetical protein
MLQTTLATALLTGGLASAAPFQPDDWSVFEQDAATSHAAESDLTPEDKVARIRIPLTIRGFEKTPANASPGAPSVLIGRRAKQFNLRARLDRPNHFYFEDWHVETTPRSHSGRVIVKLSLSRTYGENRELEDHVGDMTLDGGMVRLEPGLFLFQGQSSAKFTNRSGELTVEARVDSARPGAPAPNGANDPARVSVLKGVDGVNRIDRAPVR